MTTSSISCSGLVLVHKRYIEAKVGLRSPFCNSDVSQLVAQVTFFLFTVTSYRLRVLIMLRYYEYFFCALSRGEARWLLITCGKKMLQEAKKKMSLNATLVRYKNRYLMHGLHHTTKLTQYHSHMRYTKYYEHPDLTKTQATSKATWFRLNGKPG
jgi:hypothetical protein